MFRSTTLFRVHIMGASFKEAFYWKAYKLLSSITVVVSAILCTSVTYVFDKLGCLASVFIPYVPDCSARGVKGVPLWLLRPGYPDLYLRRVKPKASVLKGIIGRHVYNILFLEKTMKLAACTSDTSLAQGKEPLTELFFLEDVSYVKQ